MSLNIQPRKAEDVMVLELSGMMVFGKETLNRYVVELLQQDEKTILLNVAGLTYVDSSGLGEIVSALTAAKKSGGVLKLSSPNALFRDILRITKSEKFLEVYATEEEALASFSPPAEPAP